MKKANVEIGKTYIVKVSGSETRVRLDRESQYGGWDGTNLATGRSVRVRTAARLRRLAVDTRLTAPETKLMLDAIDRAHPVEKGA